MNKTVAKILIWSAVGCVAIFAAAYGIGYYEGYTSDQPGGSGPPDVPLWLFVPFVAVVMGGSVWVGAIWMRSIDEAAQEAHKWAWYWGGSIGLAIAGAVGLMAMLPQAADIAVPSIMPDRADPAAYMATGAAAMGLLMMAGYTIAWAIWWWRHR